MLRRCYVIGDRKRSLKDALLSARVYLCRYLRERVSDTVDARKTLACLLLNSAIKTGWKIKYFLRLEGLMFGAPLIGIELLSDSIAQQ